MPPTNQKNKNKTKLPNGSSGTRNCLFLVHHALVEGELLALEDVPVAPSGLSRSGGDLGEDTPRGELGVEGGVQASVDLPGLELLGDLGGFAREVDGLAR